MTMAAVMGVIGGPCARAADQVRPFDRQVQRVEALLGEGRYAELDALELRSRDPAVVLEDGQPVRYAFFNAIECGCGGRNRDAALGEAMALEKKLDAWRKANPESRAARLGMALQALAVAGAYRGQGWAGDVPPQNWAPFRENVARAVSLLDAMPPEMKSDPEWYATRLKTLRIDSPDRTEYESLLSRALEEQPRGMEIYFEAVQHFQPNWGGSDAELRAFIDQSALRTREWWGDTMYARLNWFAKTGDMFKSGRTDWKRMKSAFEQLLEKYPDPWTLNNFGSFACTAYDFRTLGAMAERIRANAVMAAWGGMGNYERCIALAEQVHKAGAPK
jgi:hypothetical protein